MPIQFNGLASGLDTATLVKQLMQIESQPLVKMQNKLQIQKWRQGMLNDFKTKLLDLQNKAASLTLSTAFTAKKVSSSDETIATASASTAAVNGTYLINATLATSSTSLSTAVVGFNAGSKATLVSSAEMNISPVISVDPNAKFNDAVSPPQFDAPNNVSGSVHAGYFYINNIRIDVANDDTINTVINKINSNSLTGVTASISGDKITLTQKQVGATPTITVAGDTSNFVAATKISTATVTAGTDYGYTSKLSTTGLGFTSGTFTINGYTFSVDTAKESAQDIVNKINSASAAGVTAFFDTNTNKLTITSNTTGTGAINYGSPYDTSNFLAKMNIDTSKATGYTAGTDAAITINGANITRSSNTFDYNGVTFTLKKSGSATITVATNTDAIVSTVKDFINSYNAMVDYISGKLNEKTVQKPLTDADKQMGILNNDYMLRSTLSSMRNNIMNTVNGLPVNMNQLALIGISTASTYSSSGTAKGGSDAKLVLDETKFRNALNSDPTSVSNLFMKGTGYITNEVLSGVDGTKTVFNLANKNLSTSLTPSITDDIATVYTYVTGTPAAGTNQFSVDFTNGTVTFGKAPAAGRTVKATYNYFASAGSDAGVAVRIKAQMETLTKYAGMIDSRIGSSGSLTKEIKSLNTSISNMQDRLSAREEQLNRQFTAMEKALSTLKNHGSWLTSQIASLPTK